MCVFITPTLIFPIKSVFAKTVEVEHKQFPLGRKFQSQDVTTQKTLSCIQGMSGGQSRLISAGPPFQALYRQLECKNEACREKLCMCNQEPCPFCLQRELIYIPVVYASQALFRLSVEHMAFQVGGYGPDFPTMCSYVKRTLICSSFCSQFCSKNNVKQTHSTYQTVKISQSII